MSPIEILQYDFAQYAILTGIALAVLWAILGVFLTLRNLSLIGDGLAHVSFGAIAIGLSLGIAPMTIALPIVVLASYGMSTLTKKAHIFGDAAIGIISTAGLAIGIMVASAGKGFSIDISSYLFGSILSVGFSDVILSIALMLVTIALVRYFYRDLVAITFDDEYAQTLGIQTNHLQTGLAIGTGIATVLSVRIVGALLVSGMLLLPAITALQWNKSFAKTIPLACIFAVLSVVIGMGISFSTDMPTGATIVLTGLGLLAASFIYRQIAAKH